MIKPSENVIRAIINLESNVSWQGIVDWIRDSLFAQAVKGASLSGEDTIKNQGRCLELDEITKHIKNVHNYIKK